MNNPFIIGARVAILRGSFPNSYYIEDFVLKVHKSGRFTLRGAPAQQWRPWEPGHSQREWHANSTGDVWARGTLIIWDETTDAQIKVRNTKEYRRRKQKELAERLKCFPEEKITDEMLNKIEEALNAA